MSLSDLELSARSFMERSDREYCHRALELKVFGQCQDTERKSDKSEQHPWVAEFYRSKYDGPEYCVHAVFGKPKPKSNKFRAVTLTSFTVDRTRKHYGRGATPIVCCSGEYDMTPDDFNYYEKRGYVRRL